MNLIIRTCAAVLIAVFVLTPATGYAAETSSVATIAETAPTAVAACETATAVTNPAEAGQVTAEATTEPHALADAQAVEDAAIAAQILALQAVFPEETPWTDATAVYSNYPIWPYRGRGCAAFAMLISDVVYGTGTPVVTINEAAPADIQVGDVVRIGGYHSVVVIAIDGDSITICEGNYNGGVHWGRVLSAQELTGQISYLCRRLGQ